MAEAADQIQHDFWRAPMPAAKPGTQPGRTSTCDCGTEFIVSSLYCHACGVRRPGLNPVRSLNLAIPGLSELAALSRRLQLTPPALVAFLIGLFCVLGALTVSLFFTVRTLSDWQAIQFWRIEWLLAAVAAFVAGCLFKR